MSGSRQKLRAVLLAFVMVTSIMAAGVAFTGTAAAADFDGLKSVDSVTAPDIEIAQSDTTQTIDVQYTHEASENEKETVEVDLDSQISGSASITSVSNLQVTGDTGDVTVNNLQTTSSGGETNGYTFDSEQTSGTDPQVTVSVDVQYDTTGQSTTGTQTVTAKDGNGQTATASPSFVDTNMDLVSSETRDSDNDGQVDIVIATMSQEVDDSATSFGSDTFTIGASGRSVGQVSAGSGTDDETVAISVSGFPADDTAVTETGGGGLQLEPSSGVSSLIDKSGTEHVDSATRRNIDDGAAVTIVDAQTSSLDSNGNVDQIDIGFSEALADTGSTVDADDISNTNLFTLSQGSITGYSGDTNARSDDNSVTGEDVTADVANVQGASATPQVTLRSGSITVQDGNGNSNNNDVTVDSSNGVTATLAGEGDNNIKTEIGGNANQPILSGQNAQDLNLIRIRDVSGGASSLSTRTILEMPDGITINEDASDLLITTTGNLEVTGSAIQNNGQQLRVNHSASSSGGDLLRVRGLAVDATTNFSAQQGQDASTSDITVDYAIDELDTALLSGEKPQVDVTDGGAGSVGAGASGVTFPGDIDVTAPASIDNAIGNQTNIVVEANASNGITFDTDIDPTNIPVTEPTDGAVDMSEASITENELTIPVTANFTAGETLQIDANDVTNPLQVDVAGDASDFKLDVRTESATASNGEVTADNVAAETTISRPTLDIDDSDAGGNVQSFAVGIEDQKYTASNEQIAITTTDTGQIADGSTVTLTTNRSGVTFNPDQTIQAPDGGDAAEETNNDDANIDVYVDTGTQPNSEVVTNPSVSADEITFDVETGNQNDIGTGVKIIINDPEFSVASSVPDEARFSLNATFEPRSNVQTTSTETHDDFFEVERPNVEFNDNSNLTAQLDADGITDLRVKPQANDDQGDPADNALVITADDVGGQIPADTTVTVTLPSSSGVGVTFDQSKSLQNEVPDNDDSDGGDTGEIDISETETQDISSLSYTEDRISITIGSNDGIEQDDKITIDELFFNATSSAQNVSLDVTTNPGSQVTTTDDNVVKFQSATPSGVFGDARLDTDPGDANNGPDRDASSGGDYGPTDSGESTALQTDGDAKATGETFTSSVYVDNGDGFGNSPVSGAFGQADIDLSIVETPDGSSGASLNDTSLTTNSNGFADFEFTLGDGVGTYIVNASTSNGGTNITYEATAGQVSQLNVTQVKDGLATGTDSNTGTDTDVAVFRVRTEDSGGNIAPADVDFGTVFTGGSASVVELYEDYQVSDGSVGGDEIVSDGDLTDENGDAFDDGDGDSRTNYIQSNDDNGQAGVFFVAVAGSTEQTVDIELAPESGDISSGSATADLVTINDVDVAINDSTTSPESTVTATATPQSGDGDVTVPRLSASFSISNTTVATFDAASSVTTNVSGVATVNLTAEENGTATVSAITRNRQGSADITVEEAAEDAPANFEVSDLAPQDATVNVSEAFDVSATVENTGDLQGEQEIELRLEPDGDAVGNQTVSLDAGENDTVSFENVTVDTAGEFNHTVASANDSATGSLTVEEAQAQEPSVSVNFTDQTVPNGTEEVTVDSANFTRADGSAGDYVVVVHVVNDDEFDGGVDNSISAPVGASENLSNGAENITVDLNSSAAFEDGDALDSITENVTLRAMLHTTDDDSAFGTRLGNAIDGIEPGDETDDANITIEEVAEDAPANFEVSDLEPQDATVNVSEAFDVSATVENTGDLQGEQEIELRLEPDGDAVRNQTVSLDAGENDTVTFENVTVDTAGEFNHTVASDNDSATGSLTVEQREQEQEPSVSVNFTDQTVPNDTEEVTVDSANFTRADGSAGDYVVVVHVVNDDEFDGGVDNSISAPVGASGNLSNGAENITVDLNSSAAFEDGDALDSITENVTLRAMLHTTDDDSAFGTRLGNAIDGIEPGDETDDANITVEQQEQVNRSVEVGQRIAGDDNVIGAFELLDAVDEFRNGEIDPFVLLELIDFFRNETDLSQV